MSFDKIPAGTSIPDDFNVIIEIPTNSDPVKYEIDKDSDAVFVDRFMTTTMFYPANYGYIPQTLAGDGDPIDVLVVTPYPVIHGSVVRCRAVGILNMTDEKGEDVKLLAVPHDKLTSLYREVKDYHDLPELLIRQIQHFFEHYKDLEEGKWVKVESWEGPEAAKDAIIKSAEAYQNA
ncbi:MAG: inorganic diphosphatase [Endozoicomonadaceae bacterium]|nr:inorganic diphosphatase [Endozoicomonadaceae bacterium]